MITTGIDMRMLMLTVGEYRAAQEVNEGLIRVAEGQRDLECFLHDDTKNDLELLAGEFYECMAALNAVIDAHYNTWTRQQERIRQLESFLSAKNSYIEDIQNRSRADKRSGRALFLLLNAILDPNQSEEKIAFTRIIEQAHGRIEAIKAVRNHAFPDCTITLTDAKMLVDQYLRSIGLRTNRQIDDFFRLGWE